MDTAECGNDQPKMDKKLSLQIYGIFLRAARARVRDWNWKMGIMNVMRELMIECILEKEYLQIKHNKQYCMKATPRDELCLPE